MGRKHKYCSAQPYYDYIGVPEHLRREYDNASQDKDDCIHRARDWFCTLDGGYCGSKYQVGMVCPNYDDGGEDDSLSGV